MPALPPRDREATRAARAWKDYSPQKAPRRGCGEESRPGARPSSASGRAGASRRRRKRRATAPPVTSFSASLPFPAFTPLAGAGRSHFSPYTLDKTSFPLWLPVFFFSLHVTHGADLRLGQRLPGSCRPSTPAGPGLRGSSRGPFAVLGAACPLWALFPNTLQRGHSFPGFQQVLSGSVAIPPRGTGLWASEAAPRRPRGGCRFPGREPVE